jgi:hypothetical protein
MHDIVDLDSDKEFRISSGATKNTKVTKKAKKRFVVFVSFVA